MGEPNLVRLLFLTLLAMTVPATAQEPTPTPTPKSAQLRATEKFRAQAAALSAAIARLPAATVDKATVTLSPEATAPAPGDVKPDTGPGTPTLTADIAEVQPAPAKLQAREILFVPLKPADEEKTRMAVVARMQAEPPTLGPANVPQAPRVEVFAGAIRTLAVTGAELTLKPMVKEGPPLSYVADRGRFEGAIMVGVVDIGGQGAAHRLSQPIIFQVTGPLVATPELARVETTGPPYQTVVLAGNAMGAVVEVNVISSVTPEGVGFKVPVLPALFVDVKRRLQGWGLEAADIVVRTRALPAAGNREVELSADPGEVEPRTLTLNAGGRAEASIRSASTGTAYLSASGPAFAVTTVVPIEFVFPTPFLLAGLIGGICGGLLRVGVPRKGHIERTLLRLGAAVICGFLVLGLYVLGVNVVGFDLPARAGEVLVFVVAALGALGGVGLLKPSKPAG